MAAAGDPQALGQLLRSRRERLAPADVGLPAGSRGAPPACAARRSRCWPTCPPPTTPSLSRAARCGPRPRCLTRWRRRCGCPPPSGATCRCSPTAPTTRRGGGTASPRRRRAARPGRRRPGPAPRALSRPWSKDAAGTCWPPTRRARAVRRLGRRARGERNLVRWMFTTDRAREVYLEWEPEARAMLGRFRLAAARYPRRPGVRSADRRTAAGQPARQGLVAAPRRDRRRQRVEEAAASPVRAGRLLPRRPAGRRQPGPDARHLLPCRRPQQRG